MEVAVDVAGGALGCDGADWGCCLDFVVIEVGLRDEVWYAGHFVWLGRSNGGICIENVDGEGEGEGDGSQLSIILGESHAS
jgi:hypothetical protein